MKSSSSGGRDSRVPWRQSQSGNSNNRGSYKRYGEVNFLQLVGTKSSDERQKSKQREQKIKDNNSNNKMTKTVANTATYLNITPLIANATKNTLTNK